MGCHFLLQGIFPTQGSNLGIPHCRQTLYRLTHQGSNCQHPLDHRKTREFQKNSYFCFIEYAKAFDCVYHNKLWKILQEKGILDHLTGLLQYLYACQEATVRTRHETTDWSKLGKEYLKALYCHPVHLTSMQSTSWEMLGWM